MSMILRGSYYGLNHIRQALKENANVNIMCIGDSITEGYAATNFIDNRYISVMVNNLQRSYKGAAGGLGFANIYSAAVPGGGSTSGTAYWTKAHSTQVTGQSGTFGDRTYTPDVNEVLTFNYTGTSIKLQYAQGTGSNVPFTVNVDGGGAVTVTPSTTGGLNNQATYSTPVLSHSTHSAVITPQASGIAYIKGAFVYDGDETAGIHLWDSGHYGYTSTDIVGSSASSGSLTDLMSTNLCSQPDLVTIMLGLNDGQISMTAATFYSNMKNIIANIATNCTTRPSFLLVAEYNAPSGYGGSQSGFFSVMQQIASEDTDHITAISLIGVMGAADISGDNLHPSNVGYAKIGTIISDLLTRPAGLVIGGLRPYPFSPGIAR